MLIMFLVSPFRRQLMAKVPCWEKAWVLPENAASGSALRVFKWVKTDKIQVHPVNEYLYGAVPYRLLKQFSDDEVEDEPLAPLPDEPEVVEDGGEGDDEIDQDEPAASVGPEIASVASDSVPPKESEDTLSKPPSPKPHPLSISFQPTSEPSMEHAGDDLDASLKPLDGNMDTVAVDGVNVEDVGPVDVEGLDMSVLGPDGTAFESAHDLSQMEATDALVSRMPSCKLCGFDAFHRWEVP